MLLYLVSLHISIWLFAYIFMVSLGIFYIYCWLAVAFVRFANDLLLKIKQFKLYILQMQHALFDLLGTTLVPELGANVAAGTAGYI